MAGVSAGRFGPLGRAAPFTRRQSDIEICGCLTMPAADMSIEGLWRHFNSNRPTPQTTIEAICYAVRERGLDALKEPATIERLSRCDDTAQAEIRRRIARQHHDGGKT